MWKCLNTFFFLNYSLFFVISFYPLVFMQSNLNPGHYKASRIHGCTSALIGDAEENATLSAAPRYRKINRQVPPAAHTEIQMQNPSVISGSTTLLSLESGIISSDDDEEEDTFSSLSSNSLPSPEVFRKETSCEWSFCVTSTTMLACSDIFVYTCFYSWSTNLLFQGSDTGCSSQ